MVVVEELVVAAVVVMEVLGVSGGIRCWWWELFVVVQVVVGILGVSDGGGISGGVSGVGGITC